MEAQPLLEPHAHLIFSLRVFVLCTLDAEGSVWRFMEAIKIKIPQKWRKDTKRKTVVISLVRVPSRSAPSSPEPLQSF